MIAGLTPTAGDAYTAAGDRNFPAQLILPQIGPTDALWVPISTQPFEAVNPEDKTRQTDFSATYSKLITEQGSSSSMGLPTSTVFALHLSPELKIFMHCCNTSRFSIRNTNFCCRSRLTTSLAEPEIRGSAAIKMARQRRA